MNLRVLNDLLSCLEIGLCVFGYQFGYLWLSLEYSTNMHNDSKALTLW